MNKTKWLIGAALAGATLLGAVLTTVVSAQSPKAAPKGPVGRAEVEQIVRDYIREHPEVIVESLNAYAENKSKQAVAESMPLLLDEKTGFAAGKNTAAAKIAVIELFDYHCGYCKRATGFVKELIKSDPAVKVVFRELPILRRESELAARYALAARAQGKYTDFHFAMLEANGVLDEARIKEIAGKIGLDAKKLAIEKDSAQTQAAIEQNKIAARDLQIDGTPSFIVATLDGSFHEVIPGFRPDDVKAAIERAKKAK